MSQADLDQTPEQQPDGEPQSQQLESGTYEIIRNRLANHASDLRDRLGRLNASRKDVFGAIETTLKGTDRVTTEHNCTPRDMIAIGDHFIFGYNIHFGLKATTHPNDVFATYKFNGEHFQATESEFSQDPQFQRDFEEIYKYYKNAEFAKFFVIGPFLYMAFQVGKNVTELKSLKWRIEDDSLIYIDNRSDHEVRFPGQHDFSWKRVSRDLFVEGEHPHVSIEDHVFVETIGGDLTIKVENNTSDGVGLYSEPVQNADQTLDDSEIYYAIVGSLVLLKIRPYQEDVYRYFIFNEKVQSVYRVDSLETSCVLLPDDHGVIFSNGYSLVTGEHKTFDTDLQGMLFDSRLEASNGEDFLYVFYNPESGVYVQLRYNLINQEVDTPVICHGAAFFPAGEMICFRAEPDAQKHHTLQIWQTPYVEDGLGPESQSDSFLFKIGNKEIVRGMAECHEVIGLIEKDDTYADLYVDLVKKSGDIVDSYFWASEEQCANLSAPLAEIRIAAESAIDEFEKVVRVKQNTVKQSAEVEQRSSEVLREAKNKRFDNIDDFVKSLAEMRTVRGEIISLKELRYIDMELVERLGEEISEASDRLATRCVEFLLRDDALAPYENRIQEQTASIDDLKKVTDARDLEEDIASGAGELEMLVDIVSNLNIEDATHRTQIIDNISAIFGRVNTARATLKTKIKDLMSVEGIAEFNSQMKLLNQAVVNYLDICDTPDKCEEFLTKVMIQLEELEGRFAEFDEFVVQLTDKREEIYNAFETRKLSLIEARNKRAEALMRAADRILGGIKSRIDSLESVNDINAYFASDLMIEKIRDLVDQLRDLEDTVKVDDVQSRLKSIREDAVRQLKDRKELFVDGENVIKFGKHHFSVNVQALDLTTVMRDDDMYLHLTGTNFFERLVDETLESTRDVWDQEVISENRDVYRAEYLASKMFEHLSESAEMSKSDYARLGEDERLSALQQFMGPRYTEAYAKGVHDLDAEKILLGLIEMDATIGLLRYDARARAAARLFWNHFCDPKQRNLMTARLKGVGTIGQLFPDVKEQAQYVAELQPLVDEFVATTGIIDSKFASQVANYLYEELTTNDFFVIARQAIDLFDAFERHLKQNSFVGKFQESLNGVKDDPFSQFVLICDWIEAFLAAHPQHERAEDYIAELAVILMAGEPDRKHVIDGTVDKSIEGMIGSHSTIDSGVYKLNFNDFVTKLNQYESKVIPRYRDYIDIKKSVVDVARDEMRLGEFTPRVMTSFVRNRLIDETYLPLIGDNLAKQMGVVGEDKRTDLMGLLLLISPPGYGKTTLMEYVANRLGIIFMKINGPAIGHAVTSLDPEEAPNAGAREEVEKLNLALEMGDNVMIYLDDIQHCHPEFLQKFISLCDAQRKIEGVYKGKTKTYDLRGRKVCVVMAGNPYTESGEKFQIPDMLANRADIYNLGEIIGDSAEVFELSYLENCLTSNPALNPLASRSQKDVHGVIKIAQTGSREGIELEGSYSAVEVNEMVDTMKKLMTVRDLILTVNREYIRSASQADEYRTEPPFKLQGSYRNMNRIAEKVVPIMNDKELETLILSNYENDSQTLTSDTESNMLKIKEMMNLLSETEQQRWDDIKKAFVQAVKLKGIGSDDQTAALLLQLQDFSSGLQDIKDTISGGISKMSDQSEVAPESGGETAEALRLLAEELRAYTTGSIPVDTDQAVQRVAVMHKVPRSILDVMENQFDIMRGWLKPLMDVSQANQEGVSELKSAVEKCLTSYQQLLGELEDSDDIRGSDEEE